MNGQKTACISIAVNALTNTPYLELDYKHNRKLVNYQIKLAIQPANIGIGKVYYFLYPNTGKQCRKLYSVRESFLYRLYV